MRKHHWAYVAIVILTLAVRFGYLAERMGQPSLMHPSLDEKVHHDWAVALATGEWEGEIAEFRDAPYFRAPLYPYFMAAVYRVTGSSTRALLFLQCLLACVSAVLLYRLTAMLYDDTTAWVAIAFFLAYWPLTYFDAQRLIPAILVPIGLWVATALVGAGRAPGATWRWLAAGVSLGAFAIARPNIVVVVPFVVWWLGRRCRAQGLTPWRPFAALALGMLLLIAPVTIRNAVVGHDSVFISSQGGVNFYIGNNPQSNGVTAVVPGTRADWWGGYRDTQRLAEAARSRKLRPSQVSDYWLQRGLEFWRDDPRGALALTGRKLLLALGNSETSNNRQLYFERAQSRTLRLLLLGFAPILAFAVIGFVRMGRRGALAAPRPENASITASRQLLYVLAVPYLLSVVVFFVTSRYRIPVVVWLIPGAAAGAVALARAFAAQRWRIAAPLTATALVVMVASWINPYHVGANADSRGYYRLGVDYADTDPGAALHALNQSIATDSTYAPAWKLRGQLLGERGDLDEGIRSIERAVRLDPEFADAYYQLGRLIQLAGHHDEAEAQYRRAIALEPTHARALNNMADILMRRAISPDGRVARPVLDQAAVFLRRALGADPTLENAVYGLATYHELVGEPEQAIELYQRIESWPRARAGIIRICHRTGQIERGEQFIAEFRRKFPRAGDIDDLEKMLRTPVDPN